MSSQTLRLGILVVVTALAGPAAVAARAQTPTVQHRTTGQASEAPSTNGPVTLTGKERLGRKWSDEQRLDNCNVPIDKRGTRPRPSKCVHAPST